MSEAKQAHSGVKNLPTLSLIHVENPVWFHTCDLSNAELGLSQPASRAKLGTPRHQYETSLQKKKAEQ